METYNAIDLLKLTAGQRDNLEKLIDELGLVVKNDPLFD